MNGFIELFNKVIDGVKPYMAIIAVAMTYLMFPSEIFKIWCMAVWVGLTLDLFTKWFAIFMTNGGIKASFKSKAFNSDTMFRKTAVKIVAYLVIQILSGLSFRITPIEQLNIVVASSIYAFCFFREFISNIENLIDAGYDDLKPLLSWMKKKEKDALNQKKGRELK